MHITLSASLRFSKYSKPRDTKSWKGRILAVPSVKVMNHNTVGNRSCAPSQLSLSLADADQTYSIA
jgi:hypothetical protein